jgi:hypothetical protein
VSAFSAIAFLGTSGADPGRDEHAIVGVRASASANKNFITRVYPDDAIAPSQSSNDKGHRPRSCDAIATLRSLTALRDRLRGVPADVVLETCTRSRSMVTRDCAARRNVRSRLCTGTGWHSLPTFLGFFTWRETCIRGAMTPRTAIVISVLLTGTGCSASNSGGSASEPAGGSASEPAGGSASEPAGGSASEPAGGSASGLVPVMGAVGSAVWFDTSIRAELTSHTSFDTRGPDAGPPISETTCWVFERSALSASQLAAFKALILVPLTDTCSVDGFSFGELSVFDADGSQATYRDTGCSYLRVTGATAMLPAGIFDDGIVSDQNVTECLQ